jgi:hypothetical protein
MMSYARISRSESVIYKQSKFCTNLSPNSRLSSLEFNDQNLTNRDIHD